MQLIDHAQLAADLWHADDSTEGIERRQDARDAFPAVAYELDRAMPSWVIEHEKPAGYVVRWDAIVTALACLLIGLAVGIGAGVLMSIDRTAAASLAPCPTEDSTGCYWDADTRGNGQGVDVVDVPACTDEIADAGGICIGEPR